MATQYKEQWLDEQKLMAETVSRFCWDTGAAQAPLRRTNRDGRGRDWASGLRPQHSFEDMKIC